ncbi:LysR family transcriptional regulator [Phaeobacter inhibens]|uniref:LysR family transcriptional regulator n=1 Tax=Phaeobacter inhibens TaxID=221822 RepID=UPI000C9CCF71|nr:LysR family transcriptional regulator [Phaeobacter inhibens]AUQ55028.1 HTH-type transcriptional regulator, LysR type [Phaeobacter inhibens]AUQ79044.1 HTH-type transcriptional regulator, LysR type [Phaeobacter inhibens]AUR16203.1 HTH-type transcriptional regulator, LysR type [Phaeobacter inhibens]
MPVSPPRPKGPPLNAMRAFEAAARLNGFVAAAQELGVTPGAVSQQVKALEDWTGEPLFQRNPQGVVLTAAGKALLPSFVDAFDALGAATQALRSLRPVQDLHIAALPCIAQLWLPQRLDRLRRALPDLKISVTAMEEPPNLNRELFDFAIFYASPDERPEAALVLQGDRIFPVCAPAVAAGLNHPEDLPQFTLLQDQTWAGDWAQWSKSTGLALPNADSGPAYSLYSLALQQAIAGAGVLMGHEALVADALDQGSLICPFKDLRADSGRQLILVQPPRARRGSAHETILALLR